MKIEFSVEHIMKIIIEREVSEDKAYQILDVVIKLSFRL